MDGRNPWYRGCVDFTKSYSNYDFIICLHRFVCTYACIFYHVFVNRQFCSQVCNIFLVQSLWIQIKIELYQDNFESVQCSGQIKSSQKTHFIPSSCKSIILFFHSSIYHKLKFICWLWDTDFLVDVSLKKSFFHFSILLTLNVKCFIPDTPLDLDLGLELCCCLVS